MAYALTMITLLNVHKSLSGILCFNRVHDRLEGCMLPATLLFLNGKFGMKARITFKFL